MNTTDHEAQLMDRLVQVTQKLEKVTEELNLLFVHRAEQFQIKAGSNGRGRTPEPDR